MVRLSDEQLRELDLATNNRLTLIDPRNSTAYVLVPQSELNLLECDRDEDRDFQRFLTSAAKTMHHHLSTEEQQHGASW